MVSRLAASVLLLLAATSVGLAERRAPPEKVSPKPVQPAQPAPQPQQAAPSIDLPPIVYSRWVKFCGKENVADAKEACLTMKEARLETGQFLAGAALIEQQDKKIVRITVPLTMQLPPGTRLQLDKEPLIAGRYIMCVPNGCIADHEVDAGFVAKLKTGRQIILQSVNSAGQIAYIPIPLTDFAKVNEGPATDPKAFEQEQKRLQEEWPRRQPK
jgi:invasion protein IalB